MKIEVVELPPTPEEAELRKMIADLHHEYLRAAEPFIKRLTELRSLQAPRYAVYLGPGEVWPGQCP